MKALLIGNGAREHVIAEKIAENAELYAFMSRRNPGIIKICKDFKIGNLLDFEKIKEFSARIDPDYVFVGPEDPLAQGIADSLDRVIGPNRELAKLESDKGFCRELMKENLGCGYPKFEVCSTYEEAKRAIDEIGDVAVKPAGLTAGKGVKVVGQQLKNREEAKEYANEILERRVGNIKSVVIEEKLEGEEFTMQAFTDGSHLSVMPVVQDHKYAYEGDIGPMTGGMGSYSDFNHSLPFLNHKENEKAIEIMNETIKAIQKKTGEKYRGILYGGFMLTKEGPKILEYNVRFGDPEAMNVLPLLKTDLSDLCCFILDGNLKSVEFDSKATVCKYLVPKGYPENPEGNVMVDINENEIKKAKLYYASVDERDHKLYTSTSRSFGIVGIADSIEEAEEIAERGISTVQCDKLFYRKDIGKRELIEKRIEHMRELRGL
jgi:phosphoribosylamine--glycine ligase